jgi:hypothetical protein
MSKEEEPCEEPDERARRGSGEGIERQKGREQAEKQTSARFAQSGREKFYKRSTGSGLAEALPSIHGVIRKKPARKSHGWAAEVGAIQASWRGRENPRSMNDMVGR